MTVVATITESPVRVSTTTSPSRDVAVEALEALGLGVVLFDVDGRLLFANGAVRDILALDDLSGVTATRFTRAARLLMAGTSVPYSETRTPIRTAIAGTEACANDIEVVVRGARRQIEIRARPVKDDAGRVTRVLVTVQDRTEACRRELRDRAVARMQGVATVAGGMAAEYNSILDRVSTYTSFALERLRAGDRPTAELREVLHATKRARDLNQSLLAYTRRLDVSPRPIDIAEQLRAMERLVASIAGRDVTVSLSIDASDTVAIIDPSAFESILVQIAQNAREAMPTGGSLKIECHGVRGDDAVALDKNTAVPGGDWVRIRVQDNGTGVEPALAGRVFEPFFTTKPPGTGLGLGLSTAYGIVKQANGFIAFESEPGVGTAVTIWLPMPDRGIDDDLDTDPALDAREQGTVVVVQPDVVFRNAIVLALRQQGFDVVEVGAAHDALHLTPSVWSCARLVVAEADMPQLSGVELARRVSGLAPGVRVLFTATKPIGTSGVAIPDGATCLAMPLTPASLVAKVRELLAPGG